MLEQIDTVVIGAGAVGLAIARRLSLDGHECLVLERETASGQGVSSRNSEVIHAGIYYAEGSLKGRLCVSGKSMLYAFCEKFGVGFRRCGKIIAATSLDDLDELELHFASHTSSCFTPPSPSMDFSAAYVLRVTAFNRNIKLL